MQSATNALCQYSNTASKEEHDNHGTEQNMIWF